MDLSPTVLVLLAIVVIPLLVVLVIAAVFLVRLIKMWSLVSNPNMPIQGKLAFWGAAIYTIFPLDVLPDPIYLDDLGVMALAIGYIGNLARKNGLFTRTPNEIRLPDTDQFGGTTIHDPERNYPPDWEQGHNRDRLGRDR